MILPDLNVEKYDPSLAICSSEFKILFLNFCSLMCVINNKKLNLANIFLFLLKDKDISDYLDRIMEWNWHRQSFGDSSLPLIAPLV